MECKWLPELIPCENLSEFALYEQQIYQLFRQDFIETHPLFENKRVQIRKLPYVNGYEQAFYHVTSSEYLHDEQRFPDLRRCERIKWVRAFIENYGCDPALCEDCDGIKVWDEPKGSNTRVHLLFEEEKYMVILERRKEYVLLITAYYFDYNNTLEKQLKQYRKYAPKRQDAP